MTSNISDRSGSNENPEIADLVDANHILFERGVLDAFGHVSVRDSNDPGRYFLSRNLAPALVETDDIQSFNLDSETADPRPSYLERFIHGEIYRSRPDVMAVVHSHSPAVLPFGVTDVGMRAIIHVASFLGTSTPVFEIREPAGIGSDLLVTNGMLGHALAGTLGQTPVALMRGHGSVAVGSSLPEAVFRAVFTEVNARVQAEAVRLGNCTYLTAEEGEAATESIGGQIQRAWTFWKMEARSRAAQ